VWHTPCFVRKYRTLSNLWLWGGEKTAHRSSQKSVPYQQSLHWLPMPEAWELLCKARELSVNFVQWFLKILYFDFIFFWFPPFKGDFVVLILFLFKNGFLIEGWGCFVFRSMICRVLLKFDNYIERSWITCVLKGLF
jgi:hypothetical protein